jgi:hypothetical protein
MPGGSLPRQLARPEVAPPPANGRRRPLGAVRSVWQDLDDDDVPPPDVPRRVSFRTVADLPPGSHVRISGRPSRAALIGLVIVVAVVVLAVLAYRLAPA